MPEQAATQMSGDTSRGGTHRLRAWMTWMATGHPHLLFDQAQLSQTNGAHLSQTNPGVLAVKVLDLLDLTRPDQPCRQFIYMLRRCYPLRYSWIQLGQKSLLIGEATNIAWRLAWRNRRRYVSELMEKRGHWPSSKRTIAKWLRKNFFPFCRFGWSFGRK